MLKKVFFFAVGVLLFTQICKADRVDDAEAALNNLRQATNNNLNGGFLEHVKMSREVDNVALDTKGSGFKVVKEKIEEQLNYLRTVKSTTPTKINDCYEALSQLLPKAAYDLNSCVNDQADAAISLIYDKNSDLTDTILKNIYDEQKEIITCGSSDTACLDGVISKIQGKIADVPHVVNDEIELIRQTAEEQIGLIKACTSKAVQKTDQFVRNCIL